MKAYKFDQEESKKKKVNKNEKRLAHKLGGCRRPNSGAIQGLKGDVVFSDFLVDMKQTEKNSIRVKLADLQKIVNEANGAGKEPALILHFENVKNIHAEWIVCPVVVFKGDS